MSVERTATLRIAIVGGISRSEHDYRAVAEQCGVEIAFHSGDVRGHKSAALVEIVARSDVVIVLTDVNSHGAMARRTARRFGRRIELHRRFSPSRLAARMAA